MNFYKTFRVLDSVYLWLLGIGVGCIVACGMFAAPIIFKASNLIPALSVSDSGLIMGNIFLKCNAFFNILAVVIIVYEAISFSLCKAFAHSNQRRLWFVLGGISVIMIFLFTLYYTPFIMDAQSAGNLGTPEFDSMHKQSEYTFKILLVSLSALMIWRGILGSNNPACCGEKA